MVRMCVSGRAWVISARSLLWERLRSSWIEGGGGGGAERAFRRSFLDFISRG